MDSNRRYLEPQEQETNQGRECTFHIARCPPLPTCREDILDSTSAWPMLAVVLVQAAQRSRQQWAEVTVTGQVLILCSVAINCSSIDTAKCPHCHVDVSPNPHRACPLRLFWAAGAALAKPRQVWWLAGFILMFTYWVCWIWAGLDMSSAAQQQGAWTQLSDCVAPLRPVDKPVKANNQKGKSAITVLLSSYHFILLIEQPWPRHRSVPAGIWDLDIQT